MSARAQVPNPSTHDVVTFDLVVNGNAVDSGYQVLSVSTTKEVNRVPSARIVLRDGEASDADFPISNTDDFIPGNDIQIKIGRDRQNATVFKGIIVKHHIKISEKGNAELIIECRDRSARMTLGRKNHYYEDSKDSEVIEEIIGRNPGLTAEVQATDLVHKELVQHHCTDWDFILSRAEANGRLVIADDGVIRVKKPDMSQDPALPVSYGSSIIEFEAEIDARTQWKSVEAKAWDYSNQTLFEFSSDSAPVSEPGNVSGVTLANALSPDKLQLRHSGQLLESELQQWTDAAMLKSRLAKICGRAKFQGFSSIKPGQTIELQGVGNRFNGKAFVSAVRHNIGAGVWETHVQFGLPPRWFHQSEDIPDTPAAGLLPAIHGLQIGKVVQLQNDPDGEDRILVRLPIIDNSARGIWARVASLDAGSNRGAFFRPEIDDEVIVGFVNDDPRDAVVLGMLHSSAKPAPINAQDVNHEKGFITRSDMRIHFHDDTKTITISTPAGNSIILNEQSTSIVITDQNNNTLKMEPAGITLNSPANITIEAGAKIDIKATAALTIGAAQIAISAQSAMEVKGATAKLAGTGITEITGSLVKIN
ncbi:MAG: type VI secretion system tip protein VgrG [Saprospiraceae bacterium]|nr:type VI secretion system tip protein VgrG [Saprospiraceae bacterium]